jgi:hypothetical protein
MKNLILALALMFALAAASAVLSLQTDHARPTYIADGGRQLSLLY